MISNIRIKITGYFKLMLFFLLYSIVFIIINATASMASNNNKYSKLNFQLWEDPIYIVVGPSAPPITAIADASFKEKLIYGSILMITITLSVIIMPTITRNIILFIIVHILNLNMGLKKGNTHTSNEAGMTSANRVS